MSFPRPNVGAIPPRMVIYPFKNRLYLFIPVFLIPVSRCVLASLLEGVSVGPSVGPFVSLPVSLT